MPTMTKQSDIARQFELPERQSKLATMLREEGLKDEQVYCVCRSSDVSRFMIGCDRCEEWYHGDCINVTEHEANKIRKFYCQRCRMKHPGLQIKYKQKRSHHDHHHSKHRDKNERHPDKNHHNYDKHSHSHGKSDKKRERCGECEACYMKEDCGRCEYCKDMMKFGGPNKLHQRCKKRQCHNFYHLAKKKRTSNPDSHSRNDHSYNTVSTESHTKKCSVVISSLSEYAETPPKKDNEKISSVSPSRSVISNSLKPKSNSPPPSVFSENSETLAKPQPQARPQLVSKSQITSVESSKSMASFKKEAISILRDKNMSDDDVWEPKIKKSWTQKEQKQRKRKDAGQNRKKKPRKDLTSDSDEANRSFDNSIPRQCHGPGCIHAARPNSKYCSEECGLQLAKARIYSVLPQRIQEWKMSVCMAEERDRKQLEKIRHEQLEERKILQGLDEKHKELDLVIQRGKSAEIDSIADEEGDEEGFEGALVYCVTCGHEIPTRRAIRHMHSCFNKLESQMSFGSMYKTRIEGNNMFCDFYNAANRTYCKRLRVMCPEHTKEPKVSNGEVCGFPLTSDLFKENGGVCRVSKKKCLRHYCWDKLRRANIDMERVRQCLKLDELVEQERQVRMAITNRAGVLGLMLHSTYDHEYAEKLTKRQFHQNDHQYHQKDHERNAVTANNAPTALRIPSKSQHEGVNPQDEHPYYKSEKYYNRQQDNTPKPKYPRGGPTPKTAQKYSHNNRSYQTDKPYHDHQYFSSGGAVNASKKSHDHLYYADRK